MSDTPRTAAALGATLDAGFDLGPQHRPLVELCRELERELAALRAERDAPPDCRIYFHAHDGWCVEWLTAQPNGGQSNYYRAARAGGGK